jgi:hypothetical protein
MPAPPLLVIRDWSPVKYRLRTSRSNTPAQFVRIRDKPRRADQAQRMAAGGHRSTLLKHNCKLLESAKRDIGEEFIAVAEMAIGRGRTDARRARGLREGETRRSFLCNQF